ncbi:hypothetical protein ACFFQF_28895 [Haladaptatus pallidirubidus]|uniref:Uncharacterized protein n=1 Tax=Haladaptatus pallidirubidus TaxID=1008152 RepID=A0AAV3UJQ5_9EURY|nr:hypothetical protein [Haladaptatus pallidirubidus]
MADDTIERLLLFGYLYDVDDEIEVKPRDAGFMNLGARVGVPTGVRHWDFNERTSNRQ